MLENYEIITLKCIQFWVRVIAFLGLEGLGYQSSERLKGTKGKGEKGGKQRCTALLKTTGSFRCHLWNHTLLRNKF